MSELIEVPGLAGLTVNQRGRVRDGAIEGAHSEHRRSAVVEISITITILCRVSFLILIKSAFFVLVVGVLTGLATATIIHAARHLMSKKVIDAIKKHIR